jgi:hypothetical protein
VAVARCTKPTVLYIRFRSALHNPELRTTQGCLSPHIIEFRAEVVNRNGFVYGMWLYGRARVVFYSMTRSNAKIIASLVDEWNICMGRWWNDPEMDSPITSREKCPSAPLFLALRKYYIEQICKNKTGSVSTYNVTCK